MENYYKTIRRTAAHGLAEAEASSEGFYKWLALWALDVVCEAVEMTSEPEYSDERVAELGDVLWSIAASAMLLEISEERLLAQTSPDEIACSDINLVALAAQRLIEERHALNMAFNSLERRTRNYTPCGDRLGRDEVTKLTRILTETGYLPAQCKLPEPGLDDLS